MMTVDCPVCGKIGLADDLAQCSQCNADLECFRLLDALYETQTAPGVDGDVLFEKLSQRVDEIGPVLQRLQDGVYEWRQAAQRRTTRLILTLAIWVNDEAETPRKTR